MDEEKKIRTEKALECINAIASAVRIARRWQLDYPIIPDHVEAQSLDELWQHLDKAELVAKNLSNKLMLEFPRLPETESFVEVEDVP